MPLKYFVKVGQLTNLSDARYCSAVQVNQIGFNVDEFSDNKISLVKIEEIIGWVNGIDIVGEFGDSSPTYINSMIDKGTFNYIQINYPNKIDGIDFNHKNVIISINKDDLNDFEFYKNFLLNYPNVKFVIIPNINWLSKKLVKTFSGDYKILINPGNNFNITESELKKYSLHGLSLIGSDEIRPGYKDYDSISDIIDLIEI